MRKTKSSKLMVEVGKRIKLLQNTYGSPLLCSVWRDAVEPQNPRAGDERCEAPLARAFHPGGFG